MEEVRNYRKIAFIKNTFENVSWGCMPHTPPLDPPLRWDPLEVNLPNTNQGGKFSESKIKGNFFFRQKVNEA